MAMCKDCKWWVPTWTDASSGTCRRRSPIITETDKRGEYRECAWPLVWQGEFCGDLEPKEPKGEQG